MVGVDCMNLRQSLLIQLNLTRLIYSYDLRECDLSSDEYFVATNAAFQACRASMVATCWKGELYLSITSCALSSYISFQSRGCIITEQVIER